MLLINNQPYLNLDKHLPLSKLPSENDIKQMIISSYDDIGFNLAQTNVNKNLEIVDQFKKLNNHSYEERFKYELLNDHCNVPYLRWSIASTTVKPKSPHTPWSYDILYDDETVWNSFQWHKLDNLYDPLIDWINNLKNDVFEHLCEVWFNLQRPYVVPNFHADDFDAGKNPYPHRHEFIIVFISSNKHFQLLSASTKELVKVKSKSTFFNHQNFHGSTKSAKEWKITLRIDGVFSEKFRKHIGIDNHQSYGMVS